MRINGLCYTFSVLFSPPDAAVKKCHHCSLQILGYIDNAFTAIFTVEVFLKVKSMLHAYAVCVCAE